MGDFADGKLLYLSKQNIKGARVLTLPIKIIRNNTTIIRLNNNANYNEFSKEGSKTLEHVPEISRAYTNPEPPVHKNFEEKIIKLNGIAFQNIKETKKKKPLSIYKRKIVNDKYPQFSNHNAVNKNSTCAITEDTSFVLKTFPSDVKQEGDEEFTFRSDKEKEEEFALFKRKSQILRPRCVFDFRRNKELNKENNSSNKEREILFSPVKSNLSEEYLKCIRGKNKHNKYDISFDFWKRKKSDITI